MRVAKEQDVIEVGGAIEAYESSMKLSRKTFRMQIDSIYSDKIGAAPREVTSNAFDSHQRAKQDRPFYVHAPNALDPRFFVRDFGVGMTHDLMKSVYNVIGESDKEDTDDEVGMWGLGSKSPFAYGDQYNISCYDGETVRHYGYGINERGIPTLYLMLQEPSTDPRGVQVGFSVESKDFDAFEKAIQKAALAYDTPFEANVTLPTFGPIAFAGEGWKAYRDTPALLGPRGSAWFVRQGCVIYPLDAKQVSVPTDHYSNNGACYIIDCPIGTIKVTPSREAIEYTEEVKAYLTERVEQVKAEVKEAVWEAVKDIPAVVDFFDTLTKIKPHYIQADFEHPVTGLSSAELVAKWPAVFFKAASPHSRWEFSTQGKLGLKNLVLHTAFVLDDVSPLLDPSRDDTMTGLSRSELRRISRFVRSYLEKQGLSEGTFFMNTGWSEEFRAACFPKTEFIDISFAALRDAVPRRVAPPKGDMKPPIRGLALAKAAGEQKPVFEVSADGAVAWVSSEQYRRQSSTLFKVAKKFKITALYIAAPGAQGEMTAAGIPHLKEAIDKELGVHGVNFVDWYFAKERLGTYAIRDFVQFLRALAEHAPAEYDKLAAGKGELSTLARTVRRLLTVSTVAPIEDDEKKAIDSLIVDDAGKSVKPDCPPDMQAFDAVMKTVDGNQYYNPTLKFIQNLPTTTDPKLLKRLSKAILSLQTLIPPSEKLR